MDHIAFDSGLSFVSDAQEVPASTEQQLENLADQDQAATEDDSYLQELEQFRRDPVDLNTADESELKELKIITDLQIQNLISYLKLFGKLIDIYELQAVPSWDVITIRKLLPFITISSAVPIKEDLARRFSKGDQVLLLRVSQVLERSKGFYHASTGMKYPGSVQKIFFRYRYAYKNLLQFGLVGDKDAGEQFFKGAQKMGFDFYSFHLFARKIGMLQTLAIGDFTVNMGQGLIQWQSLAFKKSSDAIAIKRQSPTLRPYNSAGEFYFNRGIGITIRKANAEATAFASVRKLNANLVTDTLSGESLFLHFLARGIIVQRVKSPIRIVWVNGLLEEL
jgi:hypothetical protein